MALVSYYPGYIVTSPDVRGVGLVNYYLGYIVTSLDVRGMALVNYYLGYYGAFSLCWRNGSI